MLRNSLKSCNKTSRTYNIHWNRNYHNEDAICIKRCKIFLPIILISFLYRGCVCIYKSHNDIHLDLVLFSELPTQSRKLIAYPLHLPSNLQIHKSILCYFPYLKDRYYLAKGNFIEIKFLSCTYLY